MNIQERLNLERENVQLKKELSVLKRKMELLEAHPFFGHNFCD